MDLNLPLTDVHVNLVQTSVVQTDKIIIINKIRTGAFLSMGLMTNFLSLKEMFRISLHGKPIFGVSLKKKKEERTRIKTYAHFINII